MNMQTFNFLIQSFGMVCMLLRLSLALLLVMLGLLCLSIKIFQEVCFFNKFPGIETK